MRQPSSPALSRPPCLLAQASLKATAAARRTDKLEGSSAAIANFIASKWTLFACVYQAYIVMLLCVASLLRCNSQ